MLARLALPRIPSGVSGNGEAPAVEGPSPPQLEAACRLFAQAAQAGCPDARLLMMLALAHKRQGHWAKARQALHAIVPPDSSVHFQLGVLSLREGKPAEAQSEFVRAWEADPPSYPAVLNLLMVRLLLG